MAHFAEINASNIVTRVIVVADEHEADGENWCNNFLGGTWKQTSYNTYGNVHALGGTPYRKNYAGGGFTYDASKDAFIPAKPYPSWTLVESTCLWKAPTDQPDNDLVYSWNEDTTAWVEVEIEGTPE